MLEALDEDGLCVSSPAFREMVPRLLAYARRCLQRVGWAEGKDHASCEAEATDVLDDAVESCLSGEREWKPGVDLGTFLGNTMRSQVYHRHHRALRMSYIDDVDEPMAPSSRRDEVIRARSILAAIEQALEPDPEAMELFAMLADGATRPAHLASDLGWTPEYVKTVRKRLNRRLDAAGVRDGEDDEEESRSDGPPRGAATPDRRAR